MIPSSPRRIGLFLVASCLAYFGPDLLVPAAWAATPAYPIGSALYQGLLVLAGFVFGPALCRALMVGAVSGGPLAATIDQANDDVDRDNLPAPPVVLFEHAMPFVLTAGLLPRRCEVFLSTGLASRLTPPALRFLLARAAVHATLRHRLAALVPLLIFTVALPDDPASLTAWLASGGFLGIWLMLHWRFELAADRQAAQASGAGAQDALCAWLAVMPPHPAWFSLHPPLRWRLRAVAHE